MTTYSNNHIIVPRFNEENGFYTTKDRSNLMRKIKGSDTKPELKLRKFLWNIGLRYRKNVKKLPGSPDIVFNKYRLVIFIDGEFWHGYNWEEKKQKIKSNRDFWIPKIERNIERDKNINKQYSQLNWKIMRFWEHEIKNEFGKCATNILDFISYCDTYKT